MGTKIIIIKKRLSRSKEELVLPAVCLFLQIFNLQKFNIEVTKICPNRKLT